MGMDCDGLKFPKQRKITQSNSWKLTSFEAEKHRRTLLALAG